MARPQQLQPGQINPQSQPVSSFIQPSRKNVAGAARPELLPQTSQLTATQRGGTTFVQGENSFARLAEDLSKFSPVFMKTAEQAGLKYVDWRMDVGEQMAMEQVQRGLAQIDEQAEVAADQRAADNRKVSAVDPEAGWLMRTLDPYQQMGFERGKVKMAGREIEIGLPTFIAGNASQIDYTKPDFGMADLQRLQAQYQMQVEAKYGISSGSPGYSKYFAPNLIRAQSRVAEQVVDDRTKYFEAQIGPQAITAVSDLLDPQVGISEDIPITQNGAVVGVIPYMYTDSQGAAQVNPQWIVERSKQVSDEFKKAVARAPLGMATGIAREFYVEVAKRYPPGSVQRKILDAMKGPDGQSFGNRFGYLAAEANSEYYANRAKDIKNQNTILQSEFADELRIQLSGGLPYDEAARKAINDVNDNRRDNGLPPISPAQVNRLKAYGLNSLGEIAPQRGPVSTPGLDIPANDPQASTQFLQTLNGQSVYDIDVNAARQRLRDIQAAGLPDGQQATFTQASGRVDQAERAQAEAGSWVTEYASDRDEQIDGLIGDDSESPAQLFGDNRSAATLKIRVELNRRMSSELKKLSDGRPLTPEQIQGTFSQVWPQLRKDIVDGEFPIPGYMNTPSVNGVIPEPMKVEPKPGDTKAQLTPGYDLDQVSTMPRRNVRLRNWRNDPSPILSAKALIQVIQDAANGRREDPAFTELWKRAGAANAWQFIQRQMRFYDKLGNGKGWTEDELKRAEQDLLSYVIRDGARASTIRLAQTSPSLALLSNWSEMV